MAPVARLRTWRVGVLFPPELLISETASSLPSGDSAMPSVVSLLTGAAASSVRWLGLPAAEIANRYRRRSKPALVGAWPPWTPMMKLRSSAAAGAEGSPEAAHHTGVAGGGGG